MKHGSGTHTTLAAWFKRIARGSNLSRSREGKSAGLHGDGRKPLARGDCYCSDKTQLRADKQATHLSGFWDKPRLELLELLQATPAGLTSEEAQRRLGVYGLNSLVRESRFAALVSLLRLLVNPLVLILLVASGISLALGDSVGGVIIISIVLLSVLLNFFMEFQARHAVEEIRKQVATTAAVMRDGRASDPTTSAPQRPRSSAFQ